MADQFVVRGVITDAEHDQIGQPGARSVSFPRLDIDEFSTPGKHDIKWNLYLRALASIQRDDTKDDLLGYYQLAGIHGLPLQTWPIKGGPPAVETWDVYCTHATNRFLPWHRVYLLLVEQVIVLRALKLAEKYNESEEYKKHASQIRLPYWDWAKDGGNALPKAVTNPKVFVTPPTGIPVEIDNPLYSYKFRVGEKLIDEYGTVIVEDKTETDHDPTLRSTRGRIFHVLNENRGFNYVATNGISKGNSIEGVHDGIHGDIGGYFMPNPMISAFDPIFCHANIDRCYALWQAMNPNAHYRSGKFDQGAPDPLSDRHLAPFYSKDGQEWKLNMIQKLDSDLVNRTTFDHGYHYPDITLGNTKRATELEVRLRVMRLYGPKPKNADAIYPEGAIKLAEIMPREGTIKLWDLVPGVKLPDNAALRHEWIVYYKVKKFIVEDNFTLFFFFGEPEKDPGRWSISQQLVGSMHSFKSPSDICVNCATQKEAGLVLSGEIDLTNSLLRHANEVHVKNPAPGAAVAAWLNDTAGVESWLKEKLTWRIMKKDGTAHKPVEGLVVGVKSCMTSYPPYSDLDGFDGYEMKDVLARTFGWSHHHAITEQKVEIGGVTVPVPVS